MPHFVVQTKPEMVPFVVVVNVVFRPPTSVFELKQRINSLTSRHFVTGRALQAPRAADGIQPPQRVLSMTEIKWKSCMQMTSEPHNCLLKHVVYDAAAPTTLWCSVAAHFGTAVLSRPLRNVSWRASLDEAGARFGKWRCSTSNSIA